MNDLRSPLTFIALLDCNKISEIKHPQTPLGKKKFYEPDGEARIKESQSSSNFFGAFYN